jgi:hypothetical protein
VSEAEFFEDGSSVWPLEGGGQVAFSNTGQPIGAVDADGSPLDYRDIQPPDELFEDADDQGYYDQADDLEAMQAEIAELRAEMMQPQTDWYAMGAAASGAQADEAWAARAQHGLNEAARNFGRALTQAEAEAVLTHNRDAFEAGVDTPIWESVQAVAPNLIGFIPGGADIPGVDRQQARGEYAAQLVADAEREANGEELGEKPWHEPASSSDSDRRLARAMNFVDHGVTAAEQAELDNYQED